MGVSMNFIAAASRMRGLVDDSDQIFAVAALFERLGEPLQLFGVDEALAPGDLLHARDLQALTLLDDAHEHARVEQRIVSSGVEPGGAAPQPLDPQGALLEVDAIQIRDLELAARGGLQRSRELARASIV